MGCLPVAAGGAEGVERGVEVDAEPGQEQGVGCGGGALALLADGQCVRLAVVGAAGAQAEMKWPVVCRIPAARSSPPMATTSWVRGSRVIVT